MTAPDPRAWLDQVDARTNAATDGPWSRSATELDLPGFNMSPSTCAGCGEDWPLHDPDAEFIASARTDLPAATTALRAVLDLHRFVRARPGIHSGACSQCWCPYPCPTVAAITTALEDA